MENNSASGSSRDLNWARSPLSSDKALARHPGTKGAPRTGTSAGRRVYPPARRPPLRRENGRNGKF